MDAPPSRSAGQEDGRVQQTELCHRLGRTHDRNPKGRGELNPACPNPAVLALHWPISRLRLLTDQLIDNSLCGYRSPGCRASLRGMLASMTSFRRVAPFVSAIRL